jgi:broad specificity phosphatase PhoE
VTHPLPEHPTIYSVTLLRHAESLGNATGTWQGQTEFPLTETGRSQARLLAGYWKSQAARFDLCITSPLGRARETAEIIAAELKLPVEVEPLWKERDNGRLAGLTQQEAAARVPQPPFLHPYLPVGETGESQWELYLRAGGAVQSLMDHPPGRYLVISHGGILNLVLYAILGIPVQANLHGPRFRFGNCGYASLTYTPASHQWCVLGINQRPHWNGREDD